MAFSSSEDDVIVITITNSDQSERQSSFGEETLVSDEEIPAWRFPSFLSYPKRLKIRAHRSRLVERSSYFHGMLNWSFRESGLDRVSIEWDVEAFVNILKYIHGYSIDIDSENFVSIYEGSLYFGVGVLLEKCKTWFSEVALYTGSPKIELDDLICFWDFGFRHAKDFLPELCAAYLARNFMWAISFKCFIDVPYKLLENCLQHKHLTIESEMRMCEALFVWIDANSRDSEDLSGSENNCIEILKQIRLSLLPLDFTSGKRRSCFSKLVNESIASVFRILNNPPNASTIFSENHNSNDYGIRLTEFSTKMNLSSCTQITTEMMIMSLLPHSTDSTFNKDCKELLTKLRSPDRDLFSNSLGNRPMLSFESLEEVNISKCRGLDLQASIMCFSVSFPSLKRLKAAYLLNFNTKTFHQLVRKCPVIQEVDLTLDMSPVTSEQNSNSSLNFGDRPSIWKPMMSNITKLILQGRSELSDLDLLHISKVCSDLQYLNVRGCTALSDLGISTLISREVRLESILACHTSFGRLSVLALCSTSHPYSGISDQLSDCMAFNLKTLHIGSCKCLDEASLIKLISQTRMLKSLCLRDTHLTDQVVHSFAGSSLVMLDVTDTMVSGASIARVVYENPDLKCLRLKGCKNLCQRSNNAATEEIYPLDYCGELEIALGKTCDLEELSIGWGFSLLSMEVLKPAITLLREITVGLGGSLGEAALIQLPAGCPNLEFIALQFQVISDTIIANIMERLRNLRVLALSYCFGDISISSFKFSVMPCLRKLELKRVIPWMSNKDLFVLTENCPNLVELSLLGCPNLDPGSQQIISQGWPGLVSLYLEECGEVTANGVYSLFDCVALEDLLLRHNGPGIQSSFILDASRKLPLLRLVSLDMCDSCQGYFDVPSDDHACLLRLVKMAKCKLTECGLALQCVEPRKRPVHKETLVLEWTGKNLITKVVKERL